MQIKGASAVDFGTLQVKQRGWAQFELTIDTLLPANTSQFLKITPTGPRAAEIDAGTIFAQVLQKPDGSLGPLVKIGPNGLELNNATTIITNMAAKVRVWIEWLPNTAGSILGTSLNVDLQGAPFSVTLAGNGGGVARTPSAVALVLDRSGSMNESPGVGVGDPRKIDTLRRSAFSFVNLVTAALDSVGAVSFDDVVEQVFPMTTPQSLPIAASDPIGVQLGGTTVPADLLPRNSTAIGDGLAEGQALIQGLPAATRKFILVATDGNNNAGSDPVTTANTIRAAGTHIFAIGIGDPTVPGSVNVSQLDDISQGDGYALVTGPLVASSPPYNNGQPFLLDKFFLQILAETTKRQTIVDPGGTIAPGSFARQTFDVSLAEASFDAIVLARQPSALSYFIQTPHGDWLDPIGNPHVELLVSGGMLVYRVKLPAIAANPNKSHAGIWTAWIFNGPPKDGLKLLPEHIVDSLSKKAKPKWTAGSDLPLAYSFLVQADSRLELDASIYASGRAPGSTLTVSAAVKEVGALVDRSRCTIVAEITFPDGLVSAISLSEYLFGRFRAKLMLDVLGVYLVRIVASGSTFDGHPFTRETLRTAVLTTRTGDDSTVPPGESPPKGTPGEDDSCRCPCHERQHCHTCHEHRHPHDHGHHRCCRHHADCHHRCSPDGHH